MSFAIASFDLWMAKCAHDVFALVQFIWDLIGSKGM
jgi:hypothetical protein